MNSWQIAGAILVGGAILIPFAICITTWIESRRIK